MWNIVNEKSKIFRVDNVVFTSSDEVFPKKKKKKKETVGGKDHNSFHNDLGTLCICHLDRRVVHSPYLTCFIIALYPTGGVV